MTPRFHLDENLSPKIAEGLRKRDRDCTTSQSAGLLSASDEEQWVFSVEQGRVIITGDQDILRMAAADKEHPGIIYWTKRANHPLGRLVKAIDELCFEKSAEELRGTVTYI